MKQMNKKEAGLILPQVLILLAIGAALIIPMLALIYSGQKFHQIIDISTLNAYAADSGIEYARYQVFNNPAEIQASPLNEQLVINGVDVHVTVEYVPDVAAYRINSTATKNQRSVSIACMITIDVGLFGNVVACDGNLTIQNCQFLNPDFPGESDVYTHGNIIIQSSTIDGDVKASGTVTVKNSTIAGDIIEGAPVMEFPVIDARIHEDRAKEGGIYNGNLTIGKGTTSLGPKYINGNLTVGSSARLILQGTIYVTGSINITNASVSGFGDLISEGDIILNNYTFSVANPETLPLIITIGIDKVINIENDQGDPGTTAILYAPDGRIDLTNVDILGSVAAPSVLLSNASIQYPAELRGRADLPGAGLDIITYTFK
jgi:hypothetical protein